LGASGRELEGGGDSRRARREPCDGLEAPSLRIWALAGREVEGGGDSRRGRREPCDGLEAPSLAFGRLRAGRRKAAGIRAEDGGSRATAERPPPSALGASGREVEGGGDSRRARREPCDGLEAPSLRIWPQAAGRWKAAGIRAEHGESRATA